MSSNDFDILYHIYIVNSFSLKGQLCTRIKIPFAIIYQRVCSLLYGGAMRHSCILTDDTTVNGLSTSDVCDVKMHHKD